MKVRCKNLFCSAKDQYVNEQKFMEKDGEHNMKCPSCGHKGFMPSSHVLKTDEIMYQILKTSKHTLLKDELKKINYDKLPNSMDQQNFDDGTRYDIDIIAIGKNEGGKK